MKTNHVIEEFYKMLMNNTCIWILRACVTTHGWSFESTIHIENIQLSTLKQLQDKRASINKYFKWCRCRGTPYVYLHENTRRRNILKYRKTALPYYIKQRSFHLLSIKIFILSYVYKYLSRFACLALRCHDKRTKYTYTIYITFYLQDTPHIFLWNFNTHSP